MSTAIKNDLGKLVSNIVEKLYDDFKTTHPEFFYDPETLRISMPEFCINLFEDYLIQLVRIYPRSPKQFHLKFNGIEIVPTHLPEITIFYLRAVEIGNHSFLTTRLP